MKNPVYRLVYFLRRWKFIFLRVCMGDSVLLAKYLWTTLELERITKDAGVTMGDYKVITRDGAIFPRHMR